MYIMYMTIRKEKRNVVIINYSTKFSCRGISFAQYDLIMSSVFISCFAKSCVFCNLARRILCFKIKKANILNLHAAFRNIVRDASTKFIIYRASSK